MQEVEERDIKAMKENGDTKAWISTPYRKGCNKRYPIHSRKRVATLDIKAMKKMAAHSNIKVVNEKVAIKKLLKESDM